MYLIEILHQTTTPDARVKAVPLLYLIEILHQTTTSSPIWIRNRRCILSKFYIKPQHVTAFIRSESGCILSKFYIKPQRSLRLIVMLPRCILSKFYIKPQLGGKIPKYSFVVSYRNSTSNHNSSPALYSLPSVVSYRNSTSNHNVGPHID